MRRSTTSQRLSDGWDIVSGAVASSTSNKVFFDKHIPARFHRFLAVHERKEKAEMARGLSYAQAHRIATSYERAAVTSAGLDWKRYTEDIAGYLSHIEHEHVCRMPRHTHVDPRYAVEH